MEGIIIIASIIGLIFIWVILMAWRKKYNQRKCARLGHNYKPVRCVIMQEGGGYNSVCADYSANIPTCTRWGCNAKLEPVIVEQIRQYTRVSMPSEKWDELRRRGYLINN
jgi:hypothetical protein